MTALDARVDAAALEAALSAALDVTVTEMAVCSDKLNLIVAISTAEEPTAYVLHRPNELRHTSSLFNDVRQEYRVLERLQGTAIPTQEPVWFCDDASVIGDPFFVTTYLDGETVPLGTDLPERFRTERARRMLAERLIETLAAIHSLDVQPFADVCDRQPPQEQLGRTIDRLDAATSATGHDLPRLWAVAEWLEANVPEDPTLTLVHGDFRPGNVLFAGTDRPEITGVLDWETAMVGDPLIELGYLLLRWRDEGDPTPSLDEIETRYPNHEALDNVRAMNEEGMGPFTARPGSPTRRELVDRYEAETGIPFANDRFYRAFAAFGLATVWADLHRQDVEAGVASSREPYVEYMALIADSIVSGDLLL